MYRSKKGCRQVLLALALVVALLILFSKPVLSFGLSLPYLENDTLKLEPGQIYVYQVNIQNAEDQDFDVLFNYTSEDRIAQLRNRSSHIPAKSYANSFIFDIQIPNNAPIGKKYALTFSAIPILNLTSQVPMTIKLERSISILVVDQNGLGYTPKPFQEFMASIGTALTTGYGKVVLWLTPLLILLVIYLIFRKMWNISKYLSKTLFGSETTYPISAARDLDEIKHLIDIIPSKIFNLISIRQLFHQKLLSLNEKFLSEKILIVKRKEMLKILK